MPTIRTTPAQRTGSVEVLVDEEAGTVTFVSDRSDTESTVPPMEWLTVSADVVVDVKAYR